MSAAADRFGRQPAVIEDLTEDQQRRLWLRVEHVLEAETGFRSGDPRDPRPGEPRAGYDPATSTAGQRRRAKVAELRALGRDDAAMLGLAQVSERTLKRLAAAYWRSGVAGCIDGRLVRRSGGHPSVSDQVREAIEAVHTETLHRSRVGMKTRERLTHQYVRDRFGPHVAVPHYTTLRKVWLEWYGPDGGRQRYVRSAAAVELSPEHVVVHRPGQVLAMDTSPLPVKVREHLFGDAVCAQLILGLDVYTHSLAGFRLSLVSDTSMDVAMLLREVMTPTRLREEWGEQARWCYPGIPAEVVEQLAGYRVAALPFFTPETVTTDHGPVYKNHHLIQVQRVLGCNILPSRVLRPTDKQAVERAFGTIRSLLFEHLLGYQGIDVADRGVDPEADAVLTVAQMQDVIATWMVKIWQNRILAEGAPAWDPGGLHSPNTLFAAALAQGGFALQVPDPAMFYQLLPTHHVKIHGRRGVKIRGLWYDGPGLDPHRGQPSTRGGRHKGTWVIRRDPRDRRAVFFQDPRQADTWHTLRWTGLPPEGEVPSFSDARVEELLSQARHAGLRPRSDEELLPMLLELLDHASPVWAWPTQQAKKRRTAHAREAAQGAAAHKDRSQPGASAAEAATVVALTWDERSRRVGHAVDAERRRRREAAVPDVPSPPPRLGESLRRHSRLILPADDERPSSPRGSHRSS